MGSVNNKLGFNLNFCYYCTITDPYMNNFPFPMDNIKVSLLPFSYEKYMSTLSQNQNFNNFYQIEYEENGDPKQIIKTYEDVFTKSKYI